jgi:regulatory protein
MPEDLDWLKSWVAENNPSAAQESSESEQKLSELRDLMATARGPESTEEPPQPEPRASAGRKPARERRPAKQEPAAAGRKPAASQRVSESRELMAKASERELAEASPCLKLELEAEASRAAAQEPAQKVSKLRDLMAAVPSHDSTEEPPRRKSRSRTGRKPAAEREPAGDRKSTRDRKSAPERDPAARARDICLHLLTARPRTRSELRQALLRKEIEPDVADEVLSRLDDVGLIDDKAFAEMWVHSRHTYQGMGRRALTVELRRRGVDNDVAAEAVAAVDPDAEEERARQLVRKRLPSMSAIDQQAKIRRLVGMLARKGYAQGLAYRVVKDELANLGEETNLLDTLD